MDDLNDFPVTPELRDYVFAVAQRLVKDRDVAEDVTQDALVLAYRYRSSFRGEARYRTWLHRIATTTALNHLRRDRRRAVYHGTVPPNDVEDPAPRPDAKLAVAEEYAHVLRTLDDVPPHYREVLLARVDHTDAEVAGRLDISVANVKVRMHRARKHVQALLAA